VSIQKGAASDEADSTGTISFDTVAAHDPGEFAVTLNVRTYANDEQVLIRYWTNALSDEDAALLAKTMAKFLENFLNKPYQTVEELDLSESTKSKQTDQLLKPEQAPLPILDTSDELRSLISECVREVIEQMFKNGTLVSYGKQDIQDTMDFVNRQVIRQPVRSSLLPHIWPICSRFVTLSERHLSS
jgi:hypothetical protein